MFFSPLMREILHARRDFFHWCVKILHACRESGRKSVQAGDSLSMRESWKPWDWSYRLCMMVASYKTSSWVTGLSEPTCHFLCCGRVNTSNIQGILLKSLSRCIWMKFSHLPLKTHSSYTGLSFDDSELYFLFYKKQYSKTKMCASIQYTHFSCSRPDYGIQYPIYT